MGGDTKLNMQSTPDKESCRSFTYLKPCLKSKVTDYFQCFLGKKAPDGFFPTLGEFCIKREVLQQQNGCIGESEKVQLSQKTF